MKRAEALIDNGQYGACVELCNSIIRNHPENAAALNLKGFCLASLGRFEDAKPLFKLARLYLPNYPDIRYNLGKVLDDTGDLEGALEEYNETLKLDIDHRKALLCRGSVRLRRGEYKESLEDLNKLLAIEPDLAEGLRLRGACRLILGRPEDAERDFDLAVQADPDLKDDIEALRTRYSQAARRERSPDGT